VPRGEGAGACGLVRQRVARGPRVRPAAVSGAADVVLDRDRVPSSLAAQRAAAP